MLQLVLPLLASAAESSAAATKPHLIMALTDDLGWNYPGSVSTHDSILRTPSPNCAGACPRTCVNTCTAACAQVPQPRGDFADARSACARGGSTRESLHVQVLCAYTRVFLNRPLPLPSGRHALQSHSQQHPRGHRPRVYDAAEVAIHPGLSLTPRWEVVRNTRWTLECCEPC